MKDRIDLVVEGFRDGLDSLQGYLKELPQGDEYTTGFEAAHAALAPIAWSHAVGAKINTGEARKALGGVTRQALAKRVENGSLLGLPGRGTTYYPSWQFDFRRNEIRPAVKRLLRVFKSYDEYDPFMIASWMTEPNADLDQARPADLIENEEEVDQLIKVATATVRRWSS
ncbi:hypothetical protein QFZ22_004723 [Streptomyces canus]|uniref:Antitoxin Xre/MbcA/ParS-like toxin-binding domain-containing protein n=1 Tax=Streptomyces canus TaxID=58343 RepID=A0AAW8FIX1_9ACTN|nr:antitoxin Xre/MbcA/ParS toxin-binding domain-containing protein [Streptomyces canus]MDQ0908738.1 hypothetical protein [Streptomyces canus]